MNDLIIVNRSKCKYNHKPMAQKPLIRFMQAKGRFYISRPGCDILKLNVGDGVMFAFNMKDRKAWIFKENEPDSFIMRKKEKEDMLNFTSINLGEYFIKCFDPENSTSCYSISDKPVNKNNIDMYEISLT